jgi:hypothetical protein
MCFAIRHLTSLLNQIDARTKILITLPDGKPDAYNDGYRGKYGIEDTRKALVEAEWCGQVCGARRGRQTALQGGPYLPSPDPEKFSRRLLCKARYQMLCSLQASGVE